MKKIALVLAVTFAFGLQAPAADIYKINNTDNLNTVTSWSTTSGSQTPNPGSLTTTDNWYFNQVTMTAGTKTVSLGGDMTIAGMALDWLGTTDPGSSNYNSLVINSGNTLTLNGGTLYGNGAAGSGTAYTATGILLNRSPGGTLTINANVALGANQSWVTGRTSGTPLTVNGNIAAGGYTLNLNMVGNVAVVNTFSGAITGTALITKQGAATLVLNGDNSGHSGGFMLGASGGAANVGVVRVGHNSALGTGAVTGRGTQLQAGTTGITLANNFNIGTGGFRLGGTNSFAISGTTTIDNNQSRTIANYSTNGSTITVGNIVLTGTATAAFDNSADAATGAPIVVNGGISDTAGGGKVAFSGNHNTTINGANTYTGVTTLSGGRLTFNGSTAAGSAWTVSGGTLRGMGTVNGTFAMTGGTISLSGGATATSLTLNGGATFSGSPTVVFESAPVPTTAYDVFTYGGTLTGASNLKFTARGTTTDTGTKYTFTAGDAGTRTWNTTSGIWDSTGTNSNWVEGDQKFYNGDTAIFGDRGADSVVTMSGTLRPGDWTITNDANLYTFQTGSVAGATGLTKTGTGNLTITANGSSFTGDVVLGGGTTTLSHAANPSGSTTSALGAKTNTRTITVNNNALLWLTLPTGGISNTFGGGGMVSTQVPTLVMDHATIRTGRFNTLGDIVLQNGGYLTNSSQENGANYGGYQFIGTITVSSSTGTDPANMNNDGNTVAGAANHLRGGATTTFDVADITSSAAADLVMTTPLRDGSGDYTGVGSLTKTGAGTMSLSGNNTYTGNTTINGGVLELTSTGKMYNGGYNNTSVVTINDGGTWRVPDYSYLGVGKLADYAERRVINGGTIEVTGATHTSGQDFTVTALGGTFRYNPTTTTETLTLSGNSNSSTKLNGTLTLDTVGNVTVTGDITGSGALTKTGAGTLTIGSTQAYTGATTVNSGVLNVAGSIAGDSAVSLADGATLMGVGTIGGNVTAASGSIVKGGNGSSGTLTIGGNLTFEGMGSVHIGELVEYQVGSAIQVNGTMALNGGVGAVAINMLASQTPNGTYHLIGTTLNNISGLRVSTSPAFSRGQVGELVSTAQSIDYVISGGLTWTGDYGTEWSTDTLPAPKNWKVGLGAPDFINNDMVNFDDSATGTTLVDVDISRADVQPSLVSFSNDEKHYVLSGDYGITGGARLIKQGTGALTINTANSFAGGVTLYAGTLTLGNISALGKGAVDLRGGALNLNGWTIGNDITLAGGSLNGTEGTTGTVTGDISGGSLKVNETDAIGTVRLEGSNTYTGTTTIAAGTLEIGSSLGSGTYSGAISNDGTLSVNSEADQTLSGVISGTGNLSKSNTGKLTLSNNGNSFTGNVTISGGGTVETGTAAGGGVNGYLGAVDGSRIISVSDGSTLHFLANNQFGGGGKTAATIPNVVIDGATLSATRFNILGNVTLANGATLTQASTDSTEYQGYEFIGGTVTVSGTGASTITTTNSKGNHLAGGRTTTFDVADVTGNASSDLIVSTVLLDGSNSYTGVGALTKTGAGKMELTASNTYTGTTTVQQGTLALSGAGNVSRNITVESGALLDVSGISAGTFNIGSVRTITAGHTSGSGSDILGTLATAGGNLDIGGFGTPATLGIDGGLTLSGGTLFFDLSSDPSGDNDIISMVSPVTIANSTDIHINRLDGILPQGTYTLIDAPIMNNGGSLSVNEQISEHKAYALFTSGTSVKLGVVGYALYWTGGNSTEWSTAQIEEPKNWQADGVTAGTYDFMNFDEVIFEDRAERTDVDVSVEDVSPSTVVVSGNSNFTFYGDKGIKDDSGPNRPRTVLIKSGSGTLAINMPNSYSGGTFINDGTLTIGNNSALGTGAVELRGGVLNLNEMTLGNGIVAKGGSLGGTGTATGPISGEDLRVNTTGTVTLTGINGFTGSTTITAGSTLELGGTGGTLSGNIENAGSVRISTSGNQTLSGSITSTGNFVMDGDGRLTLSGSNSFGDNGIVIENGTVFGSTARSLGSKSSGNIVTIKSGGALDLNGVKRGSNTIHLYVEGTGVGGSGAVYSNVTGAFWAGDTGIRGVTLTGDATFSVGGSGEADRYDFRGDVNLAGYALTKTGEGTLNIQSGTMSGGGTLDVRDGLLALEYPSWSEDEYFIVVRDGASVGADMASTSSIGADVTLYGESASIVGYERNSNIWSGNVELVGGGSISVASTRYDWPGKVTLTGKMSGTGDLVVGGNTANYFSVSGNQEFEVGQVSQIMLRDARMRVLGNGLVSNAALNIGANAPGTAVELSGPLTVRGLVTDGNKKTIKTIGSASQTLTVNVPETESYTYAGILADGEAGSGTLSLTKTGPGTQFLSGSSTYTGVTTVGEGTLALSGSGSIASSSVIDVVGGATLDVDSLSADWSLGGAQTLKGNGSVAGNASINGTLAPGNSIGTLTVNGDVTLAGTSDFEINQDTPTPTADLLSVAGALTYSGILNVTTLGTSAYTSGQTFNLFDFTSQSGSFSSVTLPDLSAQPGYVWNTDNLSVDGSITVIPEPATIGLIVMFGAAALIRRKRIG
ncbi:MAG: autotransporter-associated beta strand repeat-containing protein [Verrucomicrobia bacterium]|nr:autotransporter-associated beta strand repeat-containing protein [Verrucomicrobiota bacterium]